MMEYEIADTTQAHVDELAKTMRVEDIAEVWAAAHYTPAEALAMSIRHSEEVYTGLVDNRVLCIFGMARRTWISELGIPWLLASDLLPDHARRFLKGSREAFEHMKRGVPAMRNHVDVRNAQSIRWLKWLGFKIENPVPFGPDQVLFHPFTWKQ